MTITYCLNDHLGFVTINAEGIVSVDDRRAIVELMVKDNSLPDTSSILIDVTRIINPPAPNDVQAMAMLLDVLMKRFQSKIAYHVVQPGFVTPYMLASLHALNASSRVQAFMSYDEAVRWLLSK